MKVAAMTATTHNPSEEPCWVSRLRENFTSGSYGEELETGPAAHHLRFAQPTAIGLKVSDEFTVPLCRGHHRQLHQAGNEVVWWEGLKINALDIAKGLWAQTHPKSAAADTEISARPNE